MEIAKQTPDASSRPGNLHGGKGAQYSVELLEKSRADTDMAAVLK